MVKLSKYRKLELTWYNKDKALVWDEKKKDYIWVESNDLRVSEPRILIEKQVIGDVDTIWNQDFKKWFKSNNSNSEPNLLIRGDNLLALKALEEDFAGKVKLIYIDPPFNTGSRIDADGREIGYEDGLEHSIWLSMMSGRLELLRKLLKDDGVIFVHIDNNEVAHLKLLMDEVFRRNNLVQIISVKRATPAGFKTINPGPITVTDFILMYTKNKKLFKFKPLYVETSYDENYSWVIENIEDKPKNWKLVKLDEVIYKQNRIKNWKEAKATWGKYWKDVRKSLKGSYALDNPEKVVSLRDPHKPSQLIRETLEKSKENRGKIFILERYNREPIYIINGAAIAFYKNKIRKINGKKVPTKLLTDFWADISFASHASEGTVRFKNSKKPEALLQRILEMGSEPGDWVLDSFAGSGTTGAVAHKMGRKWIMVEMGPHAETHCLKRLKAVINGKEQDKHAYGGGFKYCELGESLFRKDKDGLVKVTYDNGPLIKAVCKVEGFKFIGRGDLHGVANEKRYCHVTEEFVTQDLISDLASQIEEDESLAVYCMRSLSHIKLPKNVQVKRIPIDIIKRFSLNGDC